MSPLSGSIPVTFSLVSLEPQAAATDNTSAKRVRWGVSRRRMVLRRYYIRSRRANARRILARACSWSCRIRSRDRLYLSPISLRVSSCSVPRPKRWRKISASMGRRSERSSRTSVVSASHSMPSVGLVESRSGSSRTAPRTRPSSSPTGLSIEVRLPVHMIDAQHRLTKARRQLTASLGREPNSPELAEATNMPLDKVEKLRSWLLEQSVSIDKPVGDDEGRVLGEVLEDPDRDPTNPTEGMEWEALTAEVRELLGALRPIEADILRQRFGLGTEQELTLKEIGDKYNLSRERIRQLQEQALAKMRRALARRDLM